MSKSLIRREVKDFYLENNILYVLTRQGNFFRKEGVWDLKTNKCKEGLVIH